MLAYLNNDFHQPITLVGFEKKSIHIPKPNLIKASAVMNSAAGTNANAYPLTAIAMQLAPRTIIERPCTK